MQVASGSFRRLLPPYGVSARIAEPLPSASLRTRLLVGFVVDSNLRMTFFFEYLGSELENVSPDFWPPFSAPSALALL